MHKGVECIPVFINYGQHCASTEIETLREVVPSECVPKISVIDVSAVYGHSKSRLILQADLWNEDVEADDLYLPYRNLLILTIVAAYAQSIGIEKIYAAFINSNHAKEIDCSAHFFDQLGKLLTDYGSVHIEMPFRFMSKYEVAKLGIELRVPIAHTFSCQASAVIPCGACPNCVDRLEALARLSKDMRSQ
jgi:7-cyano-7-deazaguanine synthase